MKLNKLIALLLILSSFFILIVPTSTNIIDKSDNIILIPLDSRPCNTDYIKYVAGAVGKNISYPKDFLDLYNKPSNAEKLYEYLYQSLEKADTYIIYTNQLLNGGLIASRDPQSYLNLEQKTKKFEDFLKLAKNKHKKIIVVTVLPRIIPSQFTDLWNYRNELIDYSMHFAKPRNNLNTIVLAAPPGDVLGRYLSLYQSSDAIIQELKKSVDNGLIDFLVIGQDDTYENSISNIQIEKYLAYDTEKIIVQPGADELTKLIIAKLLRAEEQYRPLDIQLIYANTESASEIREFEALSTEARAEQLLDFLEIKKSLVSENISLIHNESGKAEDTLKLIAQNQENNYLSVIDIAYINRGDTELFKHLNFIKTIDGYSGWNTVGNSFGSEFANLVIFDYLNRNISLFPEDQQQSMLENYYKLLYIHYADDYLYQGVIRNTLNEFLNNNGENSSFILNKELADNHLKEIFTPASQNLNASFSGKYENFGYIFEIHNVSSHIYLPWNRTFEAAIIPKLEIKTRREN